MSDGSDETEPKLIARICAEDVDKAVMFWLRCFRPHLHSRLHAAPYDIRVGIVDEAFAWDMIERLPEPKPKAAEED